MKEAFKRIMHAADPTSLTEREERHVPVIEAPEGVTAGQMFPVTVKVGRVPHRLESDHFVQFIDLYADEAFLGRVTFTPLVLMPKVTCFLALEESTTLRAVAFCNMHGFWESRQWIRVE